MIHLNLYGSKTYKIYTLCNQYQNEIMNPDAQINLWYQDHVLIVSSPFFVRKEKELGEHLEDYTLDIINAKEGKFSRDKSAYDNGYAYKWSQTTFNRPMNHSPTHPMPQTTPDLPNMSSVSSAVSSQSTVYGDLSQDRLPKKRKGNLEHTLSDPPQGTVGSTVTWRPQITRFKLNTL